jgi:ABC-2 type transport system ATP-binding protein
MSFGYNRANLFSGLNLEMEQGNIYGLLGLNGAGKTTLMKLLTGLLFPKEGEIRVMGENPSLRHPGLLSRIFVLPEELNTPSISEKEFLLSYTPFYPGYDRAQFERYLGEFDVPRNKKLNKLSLGQKKKFMLSFGLACGSELLILDEPTNGLDIPSKGLFRRLVAEALTEERIFVISTHQVRDVESLIDPITILHEGKVLFEHSIAEVNERLHMTRTSTPPAADAEGLIYSEAAVGGYWAVWKGADVNGGPIDLEILFNTVISRPEVYAGLFRSGDSEEGAAV